MQNSKFLSLLTGKLALGGVTTSQTNALNEWANHWLPLLKPEAQALFGGTFSFAELGSFAETAVQAAQDLKGIFSGQDRAKIAQTVLHAMVQEFAPVLVQKWALPLVDGPGAAALIEAAFQKVFGSGQHDANAAPVVDASDVDKGGVQ